MEIIVHKCAHSRARAHTCMRTQSKYPPCLLWRQVHSTAEAHPRVVQPALPVREQAAEAIH